ncbi:MAG: c-type cytochrome [Aggregatilineaceae bacterium]
MLKLAAICLGIVSVALLLAACAPEDLPYALEDLPMGDPTRGAVLFTQSLGGAPACANCHALDGGASSGPSLGGFGAVAAARVKGQSAAAYTFYSILRPAKHVVRGYSNVMPADYAGKLSAQDVADLIAYLLTL